MDDPTPPVKRFEGGKPPIPFFIGEEQFQALGTLAADPFVELLTIIGNIARRSRESQEARKAAEAATEARKAALIAEGRDPAEAEAEATMEEGGSFDVEQLRGMKESMAQACDIALVDESATRMKAGLAGTEGHTPVQFSTLQDVMMWLLEQHKLRQMPKADGAAAEPQEEGDGSTERPTLPPSDSPTGSSTTGGGSEAS